MSRTAGTKRPRNVARFGFKCANTQDEMIMATNAHEYTRMKTDDYLFVFVCIRGQSFYDSPSRPPILHSNSPQDPGFTLAAVLALALGIGANSAMFSLVDGVLLRPLPFAHSDRLVNIWETNPIRNIPRMVAAPGNYYDWRVQNHVFSAMGAFQQSTFTLASTEGEPERFSGAICDPGFFAALQVSPIHGRVFTDAEDQPGRGDVVLLGYGLWRQRGGRDPKMVGQTMLFDGRPRTVIGIMPEGFQYPAQSVMWAPFALDRPTKARRDFHRFRAIARLKDGVSLERARSEFATIGTRPPKDYPNFNKNETY